MKTWKNLALAGLSLFVAATARAQTYTSPHVAPPPAHDQPTYDTFAGQIVLADVLAVGVGIGAGEGLNSTVPLLVGWSLSAPIVHLAHGDGTGAAASLALHVLAPIAGALIGAQASGCTRSNGDIDFCGLAGAGVGILVGAIAATTIDAAALARVRRNDLLASTPPRRPTRLLAMPTVAVDPSGGGFVLALAGRL